MIFKNLASNFPYSLYWGAFPPPALLLPPAPGLRQSSREASKGDTVLSPGQQLSGPHSPAAESHSTEDQTNYFGCKVERIIILPVDGNSWDCHMNPAALHIKDVFSS